MTLATNTSMGITGLNKCIAKDQLLNAIKENRQCIQKLLAKLKEILTNLAKRSKWELD